jgi:hypothetical protein
LTDGKLAGLDAGVIDTEQGVDVIHGLRADVGELLDLGGDVLDLVVGEREAELLNTALDRVPAGETVADRNIAGKTEVLRLENLVSRGVVEDGLGVDTGLVSERTVATIIHYNQVLILTRVVGINLRDGVHERNIDLDCFRNQVLDFTKHGEVILGLYILRVRSVQARDETAKGRDTNTLANTKDGSINVGGASLQGGVGVGNG